MDESILESENITVSRRGNNFVLSTHKSSPQQVLATQPRNGAGTTKVRELGEFDFFFLKYSFMFRLNRN